MLGDVPSLWYADGVCGLGALIFSGGGLALGRGFRVETSRRVGGVSRRGWSARGLHWWSAHGLEAALHVCINLHKICMIKHGLHCCMSCTNPVGSTHKSRTSLFPESFTQDPPYPRLPQPTKIFVICESAYSCPHLCLVVVEIGAVVVPVP